MDATLHRKLLVNQFRALSSIIEERGIPFEGPSDQDLEKLDDRDVVSINRLLRDIVRSPGVGR